MRITESQLRRIVREEILRENQGSMSALGQQSDEKSEVQLKDVEDAIKKLKTFMGKNRTVFQKINNPAEVSALLKDILDLLQAQTPGLVGKGASAFASAARAEKMDKP